MKIYFYSTCLIIELFSLLDVQMELDEIVVYQAIRLYIIDVLDTLCGFYFSL